MTNHIHGIIIIKDHNVGATDSVAPTKTVETKSDKNVLPVDPTHSISISKKHSMTVVKT